jgi:hypothetical protein
VDKNTYFIDHPDIEEDAVRILPESMCKISTPIDAESLIDFKVVYTIFAGKIVNDSRKTL